ncbi:MAG: hypothetical protein WAM82_31155, partial [Thermoanaerobaculia bacterium]
LGAALRELLADEPRRQEMGCRGARAAAERFSWPAVARGMEGMYDRFMASGRGGSGRQGGGSTRP